MGLEATCRATWNGRASAGKAHLDSDFLLFRGDFRLKIPFRDIRSVEARNGQLAIDGPEGAATFDLGPAAAKWADKIQHPPGLLAKLGVKAGMNVAVLDVPEKGFTSELKAAGAVVAREVRPGADLVFLGVSSKDDLRQLASLKLPVWVIWPKGQKQINENDVRAAALNCGLVDVKVAKFSETLSALKLVVKKL
jgi:hypothetical protein